VDLSQVPSAVKAKPKGKKPKGDKKDKGGKTAQEAKESTAGKTKTKKKKVEGSELLSGEREPAMTGQPFASGGEELSEGEYVEAYYRQEEERAFRNLSPSAEELAYYEILDAQASRTPQSGNPVAFSNGMDSKLSGQQPAATEQMPGRRVKRDAGTPPPAQVPDQTTPASRGGSSRANPPQARSPSQVSQGRLDDDYAPNYFETDSLPATISPQDRVPTKRRSKQPKAETSTGSRRSHSGGGQLDFESFEQTNMNYAPAPPIPTATGGSQWNRSADDAGFIGHQGDRPMYWPADSPVRNDQMPAPSHPVAAAADAQSPSDSKRPLGSIPR
jgi:hypothetical protein